MPIKFNQEEFNEKLLNLLMSIIKQEPELEKKVNDIKIERGYKCQTQI